MGGVWLHSINDIIKSKSKILLNNITYEIRVRSNAMCMKTNYGANSVTVTGLSNKYGVIRNGNTSLIHINLNEQAISVTASCMCFCFGKNNTHLFTTTDIWKHKRVAGWYGLFKNDKGTRSIFLKFFLCFFSDNREQTCII